MKKVIEKILTKNHLLKEFNASEDYCVKIENDPWSPLCIEKYGSTVSIAHYSEQNGDLVADSCIEFKIIKGKWSPVRMHTVLGAVYSVIEHKGKRQVINPAIQKQLQSYAAKWAANIIDKDFENGKIIYAQIS